MMAPGTWPENAPEQLAAWISEEYNFAIYTQLYFASVESLCCCVVQGRIGTYYFVVLCLSQHLF